MNLLLDGIALLCILFGILGLFWVLFGRLFWPVGTSEAALQVVVLARGDGGALEHAVRGLGWLYRAGLWRGRILMVDRGLTPEGREVARCLARSGRAELRREAEWEGEKDGEPAKGV